MLGARPLLGLGIVVGGGWSVALFQAQFGRHRRFGRELPDQHRELAPGEPVVSAPEVEQIEVVVPVEIGL
jgi:hypothetical protein